MGAPFQLQANIQELGAFAPRIAIRGFGGIIAGMVLASEISELVRSRFVTNSNQEFSLLTL